MVQPNLYIRHPYGGKSLLDCQQEGLLFTVSSQIEGWHIEIANVPPEQIDAIRSYEQSINVFHTFSTGEGTSVKNWYYPLKVFSFDYNSGSKQLAMTLDGFMQYPA